MPAEVRRQLGIGPGLVLVWEWRDGEFVARALASFRARPTLGFSDCLVLEIARKTGHLPLGTFDRGLAKLDGVLRL